MKNLKTILAVGVVLATVAAGLYFSQDTMAQSVPGGNYYNPSIVVNSSSAPGLSTNMNFGSATNGFYPSAILGGTVATNFGASVDVSAFKDVSIEFSGSTTLAAGAWTNNVKLNIYKSVSGRTSTNVFGSNVLYDVFGTVTLSNMATTGVGPFVVVSNYTSALFPVAGVQRLYIGSIDCTGLTNSLYLTNYAVRLAGK